MRCGRFGFLAERYEPNSSVRLETAPNVPPFFGFNYSLLPTFLFSCLAGNDNRYTQYCGTSPPITAGANRLIS